MEEKSKMDKKEDKRAIMKTFILFLFCFFMAMNPAFAVDVAPRISDREIIESLIRLESGIKTNRQVLESGIQANRQGIKANCQGIEANRQAIEASRAELLGFMKWGFGLLLTGMFILFGFILWDRQNTLKPIKDEIDELEKKKVNRLIATLKKSSENDVNIADAMRSTGLL